MVSKWDEYSYTLDCVQYSNNLLAVHEGVVAPWETTFAMLAPSGAIFRGVSTDNCNMGVSWWYRPYINALYCARGWTYLLINNRLPRNQQLHRLELVPLKRLMGEEMYLVPGAPRHTPCRLRDRTGKHWVVPFFSKEGSVSNSVFIGTDCDARIGNPPRVLIRKATGKEQYTVDVSARHRVYYYGKYTSFERAVNAVQQLFMTAMVTPEDLPNSMRDALSDKYFGQVYHECLPQHEQLKLMDYYMAVNILGDEHRFGSTEKYIEVCKQFWQSPEEVVHDLVYVNPNAVWCCFTGDYEESRSGMKKLLSFLNGKYTKTLAPLFRRALAVTKEQYDNRKLMRYSLGNWAELL